MGSIEEEAELGNKRRLPLWMSSSSTTTSTTKRKEISTSTSDVEEDEFVPTTSIKPRAAGTSTSTRKRAKKEVQLPPIHQGKTTTTRKTTKKHKTRRQQFSEEEEEDMPTNSVPNQEKDNGELTVDDLVTIAQEYVKADVEKENHPKQQQQLTSRVELSNISGGSVLTGCTSIDLVESTEVLPTMRHLSDEAMAVSQGTRTSSSTKTGDPTQDMLDLLLGPLLKKPTQTREAIKESEAAACAKFTEEIALDEYICSQKKQSEEKEPEALPVNVTKKKSSLRDKVAMFFDCD